MKKKKTVLITGIAGFLGSHLADSLLKEKWKVVGCDNLVCGDLSNVPDKAICYHFDCRDREDMDWLMDHFKPDVVVHAAATAHEGLSVFSPSFITSNIFEASVSVFSAAIANGVEHIVFMSSMSRYGHGEPFGPPFKEDVHIPAPVDPYAIAKVASEDVLKMLSKAHGFKWSIVVPHNIIGARQKYDDPFRNVASIMMNRCMNGDAPIVYGDGEQKRCFSPIEDCIDSLTKIVTEEAGVGEVINIGPDGSEISVNKLARMVMGVTGFDGDPIHFPDRPCEVKEAYCSSDKARRLLGYKPKNDVYNCLRDMHKAIKKAGAKPFDYSLPVEIVTDKTPETWSKKLM